VNNGAAAMADVRARAMSCRPSGGAPSEGPLLDYSRGEVRERFNGHLSFFVGELLGGGLPPALPPHEVISDQKEGGVRIYAGVASGVAAPALARFLRDILGTKERRAGHALGGPVGMPVLSRRRRCPFGCRVQRHVFPHP